MSAQTASTKSIGNSINFGKIILWIIMIIILFATLFPLWWVLRTALTDPRMVFENVTSLWPQGFTFFNFRRVLGFVTTEEAVAAGGTGQTINFFRFLLNSLIVSTLITVGQVFFSATAAYAFARLRFPARKPNLFALR